ncbi:MAG: NADH-quinone oxidoreductase subunit NuoG [Anaerolineaceae bacterium]|nr:NADH-quinone oxidoreductase subunit NuoG [Anaerolineaceae bacterium]
MAEQTINLTIDGAAVTCPAGSTVYEAATAAGVHIPTFCHHEKLVPVGACRMCLVEIEGAVALQTSCTTPAREGMVVRVWTSEAAVKARKANIEFLLTNHPLDCPVCDKGGECPLQDQALLDGPGRSRYVEEKRHKLKRHPLSEFIVVDQERCVLCWRCIRFLDEWAGDHELDLFGRGADTRLSTYEDRPHLPGGAAPGMTSKWQGNTIDVCPVGALTSRVFRFEARPWELENQASVCPLCAVGCNVVLGVKNNELRRITPRENMQVNDAWLCDRGRFGHGFVDHPDRLQTPLVREDGQLRPAAWDEALALIARRMQEALAQDGPQTAGGIASTRATNEANYLFQRLFRAALGSNNVDHLGRVPAGAALLSALPALEQKDVVLLAGFDPSTEAPLVELWLKKGLLRHGARILALNPWQIELVKFGAQWIGYRPGSGLVAVQGLMRALVEAGVGSRLQRSLNLEELRAGLERYRPEAVEGAAGTPAASLLEAARLLAGARQPIVLYGPNWPLTASEEGREREAEAIAVVENLALLLGGVEAAFVPRDNNAVGAMQMGAVPDLFPGQQSLADQKVRSRLASFWGGKLSPAAGLGFEEMMAAGQQGSLKALWIMGADPARDCPGAAGSLERIPFLVVQDLFLTDTARLADVVLPAASFAEVDGTFTNMTGRVQAIRAARYAPGEARPDWWILAEAARRLVRPKSQRAWAFSSAGDVLAEMARVLPALGALDGLAIDPGGWQPAAPPRAGRRAFVPVDAGLPARDAGGQLVLVPERLLYDRGVLLSRSERVQRVVPAPCVRVHPDDARRLGLEAGDQVSVSSAAGQWTGTLEVSEEIVPGAATIASDAGDVPASALFEACGVLPRVSIAREGGR